jgi:chromosome partitioning protein
MAYVIAFANHKGGATKTTSVANLGAALAMRPLSRRVLLVDCDPQANLSTLFGCDPEVVGIRLEDLLEPAEWEHPPAPWTSRMVPDAAPQPLPGGVHMVPCTDELEIVVTENLAQPGFTTRLRSYVDALAASYDYILIDTPPGRQALTTAALLAADYVISPIRPADFDVEGAIRLTEMLENEIKHHNKDVKMLGVLLAQTDPRWKLGEHARDALTEAKIEFFEKIIPFAVSVGMAPRYQAPTIVLQPDGRVGSAYRDVAAVLDCALAAVRAIADPNDEARLEAS